MSLRDVVVRGAREHNLRGVDVTIPRLQLTTITGVSGSGKSSLAFDTIYQEGQRRYVESLSAYARQFLGRLEKPAVDQVDGLSPTLLIDQKSVNRNPRSTVGTITEVLDGLRLLYARIGRASCPTCQAPVAAQGLDALVDGILQRHAGRALTVLAPMVRDRKGEHGKALAGWRLKGYSRAWVDGVEHRLDAVPRLEKLKRHTIELVIDRMRVEEGRRPRLAEAVEAASRLADGFVWLRVDGGAPEACSTRASCPAGHGDFPELEPRLFSFNSPHGACKECEGLGESRQVDPARLVADASLSIRAGALRVSARNGSMSWVRLSARGLETLAATFRIDLDTPWRDLPEASRRVLLHGSGEREVTLDWDWTSRDKATVVRGRDTRPFEGLVPAIERQVGQPGGHGAERFLVSRDCRACGGSRLNEHARAVRVGGLAIHELTARPLQAAQAFLAGLELKGRDDLVGRPILREMEGRLAFLVAVGLSYLTLDRSASSLSGGESQRVRLATQVGSGLQGVLYVLDEPSIGLHARDNQRLIATLRELRDRGNTVLVVEHDEDTIRASDHVVDMGPGAGRLGGEVLSSGTVAELLAGPSTPTSDYLTGRRRIELPAARRRGDGRVLRVLGARAHNLQRLDVDFPLGCFIAVTGVSGSGKSTLVDLVLKRALAAVLHGAEAEPGAHGSIEGIEHIEKVVEIDQLPIGRTPRSNPATYTGLMDLIRDVFADTPEARVRGYAKGRFSFNVKGGRCEACQGAGVKTIEMQFLPDVEVTCEICAGRRYNEQTLEVQYRGQAIDDVLAMTVDEALAFFTHHKHAARVLATLADVGLGYMALGQPSTTLSGGEAQRVKLASELCRPSSGRTLYILDEPTTGLHFADVAVLLAALQRLVDAGNTLVVVEHDLDVIKVADHVIDLGPEGGDGGGRLLAAGTPEDVMAVEASLTGRALAARLRPPRQAARRPRAEQRPAPEGRDLVLRGASLHNLQHVDVTIPHGRLTVVTGPSGSGKTSLAFDTIFAEGQRRFVQSLSSYARRFLERMERPPVESVTGLAPAIAIDQRTAGRNPRSTVATSTEIHDNLRVLWARAGTPHCWTCGRPIRGWPASEAAADLLERHGGQRAAFCAPLFAADHGHALALTRAGEIQELLPELTGDGFTRLLVDGRETRIPGSIDVGGARRIDLVVDRLRLEGRQRTRVAEALGLCQRRGLGLARVLLEDGAVVEYEARPGCGRCGTLLPAGGLAPRMFSFNSHLGACPDCEGLGQRMSASERLLVDRPNRPLLEDAMTSRVGRHLLRRGGFHRQLLQRVAEHFGADLSRPFSALPDKVRRCVLQGQGLDGQLDVEFHSRKPGRQRDVHFAVEWKGLLPMVEQWWRSSGSDGWWRAALESVMEAAACRTCAGERLRPEARAVTVGGRRLGQVAALTVAEARAFFAGLALTGEAAVVARDLLVEVGNRLGFLDDVGLGYLALDRNSATLSGGEAQRIRLASQLGNRLVGVLYVLDEPSIGLHPRDQGRLLATLAGLRDLGNTIVVVEHDEQTIRAADHVIDMGPGAGRLGGRVVAAGTPAQIEADPASLTGQHLAGLRGLETPAVRRTARGELVLPDVRLHNLTGFDARFPLGVLTVVTGVSGSGKSTLVTELLVPAVASRVEPGARAPQGCGAPRGVQALDKLLVIDQSPLGRAAHSNPATTTGIFDDVRKIFAATPEARMRGFDAGRFSTNVPGGRCETCQGRGVELVEMHFLSDVEVPCDECGGRRFSRQTLEVRWKGKTIADVLDLEVDEAKELFAQQRAIARKLSFLSDVGLGYLRLGQSSATLSGGEAQRVKLATELGRPGTGATLVVLDEPTTGLHAEDVMRLMGVLQRIVDQGNTVVVIEHDLDVIQCADWVIDLGPDGGADGGRLVAEGTPEELAGVDGSYTGCALRARFPLATQAPAPPPRPPRGRGRPQASGGAPR